MNVDEKQCNMCTLSSMYNTRMVEECRRLGGRWDSESWAWIFSGDVSDRVAKLDAVYNSQRVPVRLTAEHDIYGDKGPVSFCGYPIARAFFHDSGATLVKDVKLISGEISSGGTPRQWHTKITKGAVLEMDVPKALLVSNSIDGFAIELIEEDNQ